MHLIKTSGRRRLRWRHIALLALTAGIVFILTAQTAAAIPNPTISGPIPAVTSGDPSRNYPFFATDLLPPGSGYIEQEFFMQGSATRFSPSCAVVVCPPESSNDPVNVVSTGNPYSVRMLVRRPSDPARFNGYVIVEWLNVFYGYEFDLQWSRAADYFIRKGFAYVGVGPQRTGIHAVPDGLRAWNAARYGGLDVTAGGAITDDSLKWDIFSQAGQAILHPAGIDPLGGLQPRTAIATSDSQASSNLLTYLNTVHRLEPIYPGAVIAGPLGTPLRADVTTKVLKVPSEWDVIVYESGIRAPDSANLISWEVAGLAHNPYHTFVTTSPVELRDTGQTGVPPGTAQCIDPARSRVHVNFVFAAAYDWMTRWLNGARPPSMPSPLVVTAPGPTGDALARDSFGLALGGIRLPDVSVPAATNTGWNAGAKPPTADISCQHAGTYIPFSDARLRSLYTGHQDYVTKVAAAANVSVAQGFLLPEDATALVAEAQNSNVLAGVNAAGSMAVSRSGSGDGMIASSDGNINCGGACAYPYGNGSNILLFAIPAAGSVFTGWLGGACTGTGTCSPTIAGPTAITATFAPSNIGTRILDVDANMQFDALTDGLMAIRYLFGVRGNALTDGALGSFADRTDPALVTTYLNDILPYLDVDGNGVVDALTDGLMLVRFLFGLTGGSLINNAIGFGATRTSAAAIEAYMAGLMP